MGIADFGVSGSGAASNPYEYTTSAFQATAQADSMSISARSGSSTLRVAAFELNAVLVLQLDGINYSYWIQNGLHVDTSTDKYTIGGAYVWNFSSPGAGLGASELRGNSSSVLLPNTYYFIPGCGSFPGQCSTLTLPANLTARIALSTCGALPCVNYEYDIGAGWVTYDSVSFLHLGGATPIGFLVDGSHYTPLGTGTFYDAEWVWVAAGGGLSGRDDGSQLGMALSYWNGQRYVPVPSAWNFGADTGESSFNVTESLGRLGPAGGPLAELTSGAGTLGVLYNASTVGFLNVTAPVVSPASIVIGGDSVPLEGTGINLTMVPGTYSVALQNYSNASVVVTIFSGQTTVLNFSGAGFTSFESSGLPVGTSWGITVDGLTRTGPGSTLSLNLPNGTFGITYATVPGFYRNATDPTELTVPASSPILVDWSVFTIQVPVDEYNLPAGTVWWVNASGSLIRGISTTLFVTAANGSTEFTVGAPYQFVASPENGTIVVIGGIASAVEVQFSYRPSYIAGTVSPTDAEVSIAGIAQVVSDGSFNDTVIPGVYAMVASAPGYVTQTLQVETTPGNVTMKQIVLILNTAQGGTPSSGEAPALGIEVWVGLGVAAAAVVGVAVGLLVQRRSRSR